MTNKLISKSSFIKKLSGGGLATPTGEEIAYLLLGPKFNDLSKKERSRAIRSYEKQYKGSADFRNVYDTAYNQKYIEGLTADNIKQAGIRAEEQAQQQRMLLDPEARTTITTLYDDSGNLIDKAKEVEINNIDAVTRVNRAKRDGEDFQNYLEGLRNGTVQMTNIDPNSAADLARQRKSLSQVSEEEKASAIKQQQQDFLNKYDYSEEIYDPMIQHNMKQAAQKEKSDKALQELREMVGGDKGMEALRFMRKDGNNIVGNYLSQDMSQFIGDIGDTSAYDKRVKRPKNKYYSDLITSINDTYGTVFRNRSDVAAFQDAMGLTVDGIIGPQTEAALAYYYGQKRGTGKKNADNTEDYWYTNTRKMYKNKTNDQVYQETAKKLASDKGYVNIENEHRVFKPGEDKIEYTTPMSAKVKEPDAWGNFLKYYITGDYDKNYNSYFQIPSNKKGGLIQKPSFLVKLNNL